MCINAIFVTLSTEHRYHLRSELFRSGFKTRFEVKDEKEMFCFFLIKNFVRIGITKKSWGM
jgi:hypothetical protein